MVVRNLLVFSTVLLTILSAYLLNYYAKSNYSDNFLLFVFIVIVVLLINIIKFLLWGNIHKKYLLSDSYPITAIFFPLIYIIAIFNGETQMEIKKTFGIVLILFGIYLVNLSSKKQN